MQNMDVVLAQFRADVLNVSGQIDLLVMGQYRDVYQGTFKGDLSPLIWYDLMSLYGVIGFISHKITKITTST